MRSKILPETAPELLTSAMKISELKDVSFQQEYPSKIVDGPTIVWSIYDRVQGKEGKETKKARARGGREFLSPRTLVDYWEQWFTIIYQFDIFHTTNKLTYQLMSKFESFILETTPALYVGGIDSFIFDRQLRDYSLPVPPEIPQVSLRYEATMSVVRPKYSTRITQVVRHLWGPIHGAEQAQAVVRGTEASLVDAVDIPGYAISTIVSNLAGEPSDYIAGIDFELVSDPESNSVTNIEWTRPGKRPAAGATYYVIHSAQDAFSVQTIT